MKKRYDLLPVSFYDPAGVETWLSDQSARGLHLLQMKTFVSFEKGEPKRATYRVEPQSKKVPLTDEQKELYADFGWEYVCSLRDIFVIWRSYADEPKELHTDPVVEAELLERLYKWRKKALFALPVLLVFTIAMALYAAFGNPHPLLYAVRYGSQPALAILLLADVFMTWQLLQTYFSSKRLIAQMKSGQPRTHRKKLGWHERYLPKVVLVLSWTAAILVWWSIVVSQMGQGRIPLKDYTGPLPTVSLSELENDPALEHTCEAYPQMPDYFCCQVSTEASDLVSYRMEFDEEGEIPGRLWDDDSGTYAYNPSLRVTYYELRFDFLAEPLLAQMLDDHLEWYRYETVTISELRDSAFDQAYLVGEDGDTPDILLARLGNRILELQYHGEGDLTAQLDLIAQRMTDFTPVKLDD